MILTSVVLRVKIRADQRPADIIDFTWSGERWQHRLKSSSFALSNNVFVNTPRRQKLF